MTTPTKPQAFFDYRKDEYDLNYAKIISHGIFAILVIALVISLFSAIKTVGERETAIVTRFGKVNQVLTPGLHFTTPFLDSVDTYYTSDTKSLSVNAGSATSDQQTVTIKTNLQYRLDVTKASEIYKSVKNQTYLEESILPPLLQEATKSVASKYTSTEILIKRDLVKTEIEKALQDRTKEFYINVVAVNLENLDWSDAFDKAIEAKVIAQQQAEQAKQTLEKAKIDAETARVNAQGQADSNKILGDSLRTNPDVLELKKIEKWNGVTPLYSGSGASFIINPVK